MNISDKLKNIIEIIRPDLSSYMRFPVEGEVVEVDSAAYTCDVQPVDQTMSLLPKCRILSIWATDSTRIVVLPKANDKVMVDFENGDHTRPYIQGFFPSQGPALGLGMWYRSVVGGTGHTAQPGACHSLYTAGIRS